MQALAWLVGAAAVTFPVAAAILNHGPKTGTDHEGGNH